MKKHFLIVVGQGLSMSAAQSISNQCNQRALDIDNILKNVNTSTKTIKIDGESYVIQSGNRLPDNVTELLLEKGELYGFVAFLRENMKAKETLLKQTKNKIYKCDLVRPKEPKYPDYELIEPVSESWGWEQLTSEDLVKFYRYEALAAHIGQFIHQDSKLEKLRSQRSTFTELEWMEVTVGVKTPVVVTPNHSIAELEEKYFELASIHREYETKANYYKAKVLNLVTLENARIAELNAIEIQRVEELNKELELNFRTELLAYNKAYKEAANAFEVQRQKDMKEYSALKISIPEIFQPLVYKYM